MGLLTWILYARVTLQWRDIRKKCFNVIHPKGGTCTHNNQHSITNWSMYASPAMKILRDKLPGNEEPDNLSEGAVCLMMIKTIGKKKSALIDALKRKLEDDNVDVVVVNIELGNYDYLRPLGERITAHDELRRH